jgi:protein gp37
MAQRLAGRYGYPADEPFRPGTLHPDKIDINLFPPGKSVFVCSMGDFFHEAVTREMRQDVYNVVDDHPDTLFIFLTKRPQNVMSWWIGERGNVWLGVTAENQARADERIPILLQIPAAKRFVSVEPMLGPLDISRWLRPRQTRNPDGYGGDHAPGWTTDFKAIDWVICGGETGPGARPMHPDWVRSVRDQCQAAGVPFFFKQWGEWAPSSLIAVARDTGGLQRILDDAPKTVKVHQWDDGLKSVGVGKKAAGRLLDGREWNERPNV